MKHTPGPMTDTALIERAAQSAGLETVTMGTDVWLAEDGVSVKHWNPLTDDGDALRLAVMLRLEIYHAWDDVDQVCVGYPIGYQKISYCIEQHNSNIFTATRCAIVRAAAAMGGAA